MQDNSLQKVGQSGGGYHIYIYMYISLCNQGSRARATRKAGGPNREPMSFLTILGGSGDELMHPEAYMERLAFRKQFSDLGPFSLILLMFSSVNA